MKKSPFLVVILFLIVACKTKQIATIQPVVEVDKPVVVDTTAIPEFPAEVLYVLAREYENIHNPATQKYQTTKAATIRSDSTMTKAAYVEQQLIEFFPTIAYKGMLTKIAEVAEKIIPPKRTKYLDFNYLEQQITVPTTAQTVNIFVSDEAEMELMSMTTAEQNLYKKLNSLADDTAFFDIKRTDSLRIHDKKWHLDKPLFSDGQTFFMKENLTIPMLVFGPGSYLFYRIIQSKARAYYAQEYFFPTDTISGTMGDAYKHMLVNTLLKHYTSEKLAWLVMDIYWEKTGSNAPCDMLMDLHNNSVGRTTQYENFVSGEDNWENWANNVFNFVEDTTNNGVHKPWNREMPILIIRQDEEVAPDSNYLYWQK